MYHYIIILILYYRAIYWLSHIVKQAANANTACFAVPILCTHFARSVMQ